jgi:hypothetical protein
MHLRLLALGSRYVALGLKLQRAGYDVSMAAADARPSALRGIGFAQALAMSGAMSASRLAGQSGP